MACSNQFLNQEPGDNAAIRDFAEQRKFTGLLMDKIDVNGSEASPVYNFLKVQSPTLHMHDPRMMMGQISVHGSTALCQLPIDNCNTCIQAQARLLRNLST